MRSRTAFGGLMLGLLVLATACSGTPTMTIDEYADAAGAIADAYVTESQNASFKYQKDVERLVGEIAASGSVTAVEEAVKVMRTETTAFLGLIGDAMSRYIDLISELDPPTDVAEAHDAYVDVMTSVRAALPEMRDAVAEAESLGDIEAALAGSTFADGQPVWTASCIALEQTVRDLGRGLDLKCEPAEVTP